ncbi:gamma-glutamyl hydrolase [Thecamonas trahens ATCC 50062]|uniref:folate gamma-glutamyl hydrolase n=1 Tax=Thecamonas trahens ATCC 50062 TaxID=461836 RepID=A0A0L0D5G5_THETB|nr:gamma-glutamyl hydrolase [Thecamonas trahens ATCC 50062]KNC47455.1 gamma-glutamyl hydrolase [Thecamonas trahens ATCC 50062]|eukprot:XP_013759391.1 gamma-glutamyl hydrolase [Thecamonas trahens ATCC 50062]
MMMCVSSSKMRSLCVVLWAVVAVWGGAGVVGGAVGLSPPPATNLRPIVGILTVPTEGSECGTFYREHKAMSGSGSTSCFATVYVKWLESAGARVVPIPYNLPHDVLRDLAGKYLNGLLFTGGGTSLEPETEYYQAAKVLFEAAMEANARGVYTPVHGTCMGFQLLSILVANSTSVLESGFDSEDYSIPLDFTAAAATSRMYGPAAANPATGVFATLATKNVTSNLHHSGVTPETFATNAKLTSFLTVLSTNRGRKGRAFVSSFEGKTMPVYGTQYHPERPAYEFNPILNLNHSIAGIEAMQYLANNFVTEARRSTASFPSPTDEAKALIYNYAPLANGESYQCYFFE